MPKVPPDGTECVIEGIDRGGDSSLRHGNTFKFRRKGRARSRSVIQVGGSTSIPLTK